MRAGSLRFLTLGLVVLATLLSAPRCGRGKPPRLDPIRLYSIGDSITRAFDAYGIGDNVAVSWVNGFHG